MFIVPISKLSLALTSPHPEAVFLTLAVLLTTKQALGCVQVEEDAALLCSEELCSGHRWPLAAEHTQPPSAVLCFSMTEALAEF